MGDGEGGGVGVGFADGGVFSFEVDEAGGDVHSDDAADVSDDAGRE